MQQTLRASPSIKKRAKSVYSQRNLGTIKDRKREKKEEKEVGGGETIMRILRMRYVLSTQLGFSFCTEAAVQTEYVRFHCATTADPGDDAGRAGTARAPAAEAEGPEARQCSAHPRNTTCAGNTALISGVEFRIWHLSGDNTAPLFFRRGYLAHDAYHYPCSALASLGSSFINCCLFS